MDEEVRPVLRQAVQRLGDLLGATTPTLAPSLAAWMRALAGGAEPAHYFSHPLAFPTLLLPDWVATSLGGDPDADVQEALAYSSINGYYFIRMIDNVMDGEATVEARLLPALAIFHAEFQSVYQRWFGPEHPFWPLFRKVWYGTAEAAVHDAQVEDIPLAVFEQASARKVGAALIPVAAVCHLGGRADLIPAWAEFVYRLGRWHQMMNDVFDWLKDSGHGNLTHFLSEARRRKLPEESAMQWIVREGFAQGCDTLRGWMREAREQAVVLACPPLLPFLDSRALMFEHRAEQAQAGFRVLARLGNALR